MQSIAVVGASLAGFHAVRALRKAGFDGRIRLIGAEAHRPYDRPPLSKQFLAGTADEASLALPGADKLDDLAIDWHLGLAAISLDLRARNVGLANGSTVSFDGLVIATGGVVRRLPAEAAPPGMAGVHVLRTLEDAVALRAELDAGPQRVVVVGAGFIGAEVAATCRERGLAVTLIEAAPVPLEHAVGAAVGEACLDVHRDHSVDVRVGVGVTGLVGGQRVQSVALADGSSIAADVVVLGVGVRPAVDWLAGSGLGLDNGVLCDISCVAAPGVVAAGDVARWPNPVYGGELMRVEHWDNAIAMGGHAALRLLAGPDAVSEDYAYRSVPWFWSDQYDRKLQLAGRVRSTDALTVVSGSVAERRFAALYERNGVVVGAFGMNRPRHVMQFRALIERGALWPEALELAAKLG